MKPSDTGKGGGGNCTCVCVKHLNRCKTSTWWCLSSLRSLTVGTVTCSFWLRDFCGCCLSEFAAGWHRRPIELCPTKLYMVSLGYPGWSPGRTCAHFETISLSIFPTFVSGDRLSPEPACRSFAVNFPNLCEWRPAKPRTGMSIFRCQFSQPLWVATG